MSKVLRLWQMPSFWYAEYQDGNMRMSGPTSFPAKMERAEVLREIKRRTPDVDTSAIEGALS